MNQDDRFDAHRTIIVFTDGENKQGLAPEEAGRRAKLAYPQLVIHTVTFGNNSDQAAMRRLASIGDGQHFHTENGEQLVEVFRKLAAGFRTIITQ